MTLKPPAVGSPLSAANLVGFVRQLWDNGLKRQTINGLAKIGVCVSGGPDSMALACLLKNVPEMYKDLPVVPVAFIVDHNARPGSDKEANFVKACLSDYGIESRILSMSWPVNVNPLLLTDFENSARSKRYRLLARAALDDNIRHLFLGHHKDDQVETIIMRLIRNQRLSFLALQGMRTTGNIPCCEDIPGANPFIDFHEISSFDLASDRAVDAQIDGATDRTDISTLRSAGIQIHRPLLEYTKSQLVSTCENLNIRFVTDKSNFDPTLTMRNAVRHLRQHFQLPQALETPSLIRLLKSARRSMTDLEQRGLQCLQLVKILNFDPRVGSLRLLFNSDFQSLCRDDPEAAANALARLTAIVSPQTRDDLPTMVPKARLNQFHQLLTARDGRGALTMEQVFMEKLNGGSQAEMGHSEWQFSRPPLRRSEVVEATNSFTPTSISKDGLFASEWLLWDHRFWIKVITKSESDIKKITIRNYTEQDVLAAKKKLTKAALAKLSSMLSDIAPGKLRYTIPVLLYDDELSAFPTLDFPVDQPSEKSPIRSWNVQFKADNRPMHGL